MTQLTVETEREDDGRWIAEVVELAGCMTYGSTETAAITAAQTLALRILADRVEHGDLDGASLSTVRFDRREPVAFGEGPQGLESPSSVGLEPAP